MQRPSSVKLNTVVAHWRNLFVCNCKYSIQWSEMWFLRSISDAPAVSVTQSFCAPNCSCRYRFSVIYLSAAVFWAQQKVGNIQISVFNMLPAWLMQLLTENADNQAGQAKYFTLSHLGCVSLHSRQVEKKILRCAQTLSYFLSCSHESDRVFWSSVV